MRTTPRAFALNAPRLVTPAIGPGPGVRAQRRGALAVWATGEPILVYRRAANEPSPALAAAQRQTKVRVPADGPLRETRKGHWPTFGPLSLRLPTNSGSTVAQTTPVRLLHGLLQQPPGGCTERCAERRMSGPPAAQIWVCVAPPCAFPRKGPRPRNPRVSGGPRVGRPGAFGPRPGTRPDRAGWRPPISRRHSSTASWEAVE